MSLMMVEWEGKLITFAEKVESLKFTSLSTFSKIWRTRWSWGSRKPKCWTICAGGTLHKRRNVSWSEWTDIRLSWLVESFNSKKFHHDLFSTPSVARLFPNLRREKVPLFLIRHCTCFRTKYSMYMDLYLSSEENVFFFSLNFRQP